MCVCVWMGCVCLCTSMVRVCTRIPASWNGLGTVMLWNTYTLHARMTKHRYIARMNDKSTRQISFDQSAVTFSALKSSWFHSEKSNPIFVKIKIKCFVVLQFYRQVEKWRRYLCAEIKQKQNWFTSWLTEWVECVSKRKNVFKFQHFKIHP